ncbi:MAG: hypothetical protein AB7S80_09690 [Rhizobiaceae bacterium]
MNALSAGLTLQFVRGWQTPGAILAIVLVFAIGAVVAFWPAAYLARLVAGRRRFEVRFAAALLALALLTIGCIAAIYAWDYRAYYAQWHAPFGSVTWGYQQFFTTAAALYQFAVLGMRLFFPLGFVALFAFAYWIARMPR